MGHIIDKVRFYIRYFFLSHHVINGNNVNPQNSKQRYSHPEKHGHVIFCQRIIFIRKDQSNSIKRSAFAVREKRIGILRLVLIFRKYFACHRGYLIVLIKNPETKPCRYAFHAEFPCKHRIQNLFIHALFYGKIGGVEFRELLELVGVVPHGAIYFRSQFLWRLRFFPDAYQSFIGVHLHQLEAVSALRDRNILAFDDFLGKKYLLLCRRVCHLLDIGLRSGLLFGRNHILPEIRVFCVEIFINLYLRDFRRGSFQNRMHPIREILLQRTVIPLEPIQLQGDKDHQRDRHRERQY